MYNTILLMWGIPHTGERYMPGGSPSGKNARLIPILRLDYMLNKLKEYVDAMPVEKQDKFRQYAGHVPSKLKRKSLTKITKEAMCEYLKVPNTPVSDVFPDWFIEGRVGIRY